MRFIWARFEKEQEIWFCVYMVMHFGIHLLHLRFSQMGWNDHCLFLTSFFPFEVSWFNLFFPLCRSITRWDKKVVRDMKIWTFNLKRSTSKLPYNYAKFNSCHRININMAYIFIYNSFWQYVIVWWFRFIFRRLVIMFSYLIIIWLFFICNLHLGRIIIEQKKEQR